MPISLWHLEQVMTHQSYSGHISLLCMACPLTGTTDLYPLAECDSVHLFSQQYSSTVTNVAIQKKWNMMNEESPILFQSTDLQRPLSSTGMTKKGAGVWDRLVIFLFWLHCRYRMLYCCKMTVYLILTASLSLSLLLFLCLLLSFLATQRLISCSRLKGRSLTGEEWSRAEAVCEITWVGCLREREEGGGREGGGESQACLCSCCLQIFLPTWAGERRGQGAGSEVGEVWGVKRVKRRMKKYGRNL